MRRASGTLMHCEANAIIGVISIHAYILSGFRFSQPVLHAAFSNGARGVQLFYLVSALTLFLSYKRRSTSERHPIGYFYIRRFFRIAPMFYFGAILYKLVLGSKGVSLTQIIFFAYGFSPWTLNAVFPGCGSVAVEATYYLIFPLLFALSRGLISAALVFIGTLIAAQFLFGWFMGTWYPDAGAQLSVDYHFHWFVNQLPVFALGSMIFFGIKVRQPGLKGKVGYVRLGCALVGLLLCFFTVGDPYYGGNLRRFALPSWLQPFMLSTCALAAVVLAAFHLNDRLFCNGVILWLGRISYSLYIFNFILIRTIAQWFPRPIVQTGKFWLFLRLEIGIGTLLSATTYILIERPGIRLGRRLIDWFESRPMEKREGASVL